MKTKLFFKFCEVTSTNIVEGGTICGLDDLRKRIEENVQNLINKQGEARSLIQKFPEMDNLKMGTSWPAEKYMNLRFIPDGSEDGGPKTENYTITGFVVTHNSITLESSPAIPMSIQIVTETPLENAIVSMAFQTKLEVEFLDVLRDENEGAKPFKARVNICSDCMSIQFLNDVGVIVGDIQIENSQGMVKVHIWETDDVDSEPTQSLLPIIDFTANYPA